MPKTPTRKSAPAPSTDTVPTEAPRTPDKETAGERLTFPIKDGKIDWASVRPSRHDELRRILTASGVPGATTAPAVLTDSPALNAALSSTVYDVVAQLESLLAVRMYGCTVDQALAVLAFSEAEKAVLSEPTARVLNKYVSSELLAKYADEFTLALLLANFTRQKFALLTETLVQHQKAIGSQEGNDK